MCYFIGELIDFKCAGALQGKISRLTVQQPAYFLS
jgi:hypothetical protein